MITVHAVRIGTLHEILVGTHVFLAVRDAGRSGRLWSVWGRDREGIDHEAYVAADNLAVRARHEHGLSTGGVNDGLFKNRAAVIKALVAVVTSS